MNFFQNMARCVFGKSCGFKGFQEDDERPRERVIIKHCWTQNAKQKLTEFVNEDLSLHIPKELVDLCLQFAQPSTAWDEERLQHVGQKTWSQHTASKLGQIFHEARGVSLPQDVLELCVEFARHDLSSDANGSSQQPQKAPQIPAVSTTSFELGRVYEVTVRLNIEEVLTSSYARAFGGRVFGGFVPSKHIEDMWCHPPSPNNDMVRNPKDGIKFSFSDSRRSRGAAQSPTSATTSPSSSSSLLSSSSPNSRQSYSHSAPSSPLLSSSPSPSSPSRTMRRPIHRSPASTSTSSSSSSSSSSSASFSSRRRRSAFASSCSSPSSSSSSRRRSSSPSSDQYTVRWLLDARQRTRRSGLFSVEREPLSLRSVDKYGFLDQQIVDFEAHHFPLLFASNDPSVFEIVNIESDVDVTRYEQPSSSSSSQSSSSAAADESRFDVRFTKVA